MKGMLSSFFPYDVVIALGIVGIGLSLLIFFHLFLRRCYITPKEWEHFPEVTIVIPVKNGYPHILKLIGRLLNQRYEGEYRIIVGDDASSDGTYEALVAQYGHHPQVKIVKVKKKVPGKQGVLIELLKQVNTPYFIITDADMFSSRGWLRAMMGMALETGADMVCSPSVAIGRSFLTYLQRFEWVLGSIFAMTMEKVGLPVTGIGNNMLLKTEAYKRIGGYEALRPSLVEDYLLYMEMYRRKMQVRWFFSPYSVNYTRAEETLKSLLEQRLRWFYGGLKEKLPFYTTLFGIMQLIYPWAFLYLLFVIPWIGLGVVLTWILIEYSLYLRFAYMAKLRKGILTFEKYILFFLFQWIFTYISVAYNLFHKEVKWRGATLPIDPGALQKMKL